MLLARSARPGRWWPAGAYGRCTGVHAAPCRWNLACDGRKRTSGDSISGLDDRGESLCCAALWRGVAWRASLSSVISTNGCYLLVVVASMDKPLGSTTSAAAACFLLLCWPIITCSTTLVVPRLIDPSIHRWMWSSGFRSLYPGRPAPAPT